MLSFNFMKKNKQILCAIFVAALILIVFSASGAITGNRNNDSRKSESAAAPLYTSFRDISGITDKEIAAIETFQKEHRSFVYGMNPSTEAFVTDDGSIGGYSALFCGWLSQLFDMPFKPVIHEWGDLLAKMETGEVDFTGEMTATEERRKIYFMTDVIAERSVKAFRLAGSRPISEITHSRPVRCCFFRGTTTINDVTSRLKYEYEIIEVDSYDAVYLKLKNYEADVYFNESCAEAAFDIYDDVINEDFLPVIYSPVSLTTRNAVLEPIISVVQKALQGNTISHLTALYNLGYQDYKKHKLRLQLNEKEQAYIQNNPIVLFAAEHDNYPLSFYNAHDAMWEGIAFDLLREIEGLTGLSFKVANENDAEWPVLLQMLEEGKVSFISELIRSEDRKKYFIWPNTAITTDSSALLSKSECPNIKVNEILHTSVGLTEGTAQTEIFENWFPNHMKTIMYEGIDDAFNAMDRGEVDMVMSSQNQFLILANYRELAGFKINVAFDNPYESTFGFNRNETTLCSIMDKALVLSDRKGISGQWLRKTYDYRIKVVEARLPWLIGTSVLSLSILILLILFSIKNRRTGKQLERLVVERTKELTLQTTRLQMMEEESRNASGAKSQFIANMSHEMRTPMNVVVGLTDLMLEEEEPVNVKENLKKINTAGNTLLGLINDVLDISKIEAGKLELMPIQYDVASLLNDIITLNIIRIEDKPITFQLDIDEKLPCALYGDDLRVKQVANNLLSNAFKYTRKGAVTLGIRCEWESDENVWVSMYVSDTGIGIRPEDMGKLFSDYNQVDTRVNRKVEGTGLGLSITKKLVELMDGEVSVESEYGVGTTFRLRIRQCLVDDKTIGSETAENLRGFRYADNRKLIHEKLKRPTLSYARVLVVDDMQTNLDVAMGMLRKYKIQVDCVLSGLDAIERMTAGEPVYDAIFMDHMMPEIDGIEATKQIRALGTKYAQATPIIALTANAIAGNEQMFLDNGFQAFLTKPISIMNLDSIIQRWVRDKSREQ